MGVIDRDGVSIYYEVHGTVSERPPLLLSHGYSASADMWIPNLAALSGERQVITWDMRGHGRSDSPADPALYTPELCLDDIAAILDHCEASRAVVGGQSLGGFLTLAFNLRHPEMVLGMVLIDCGPGYRRDARREKWNAMAVKWGESFVVNGLAALGNGVEVKNAPHRSAQGLANAARGILTQQDARVIDSLCDITVPTLVLVGAEDNLYLAATEVMAAKIPGAISVVIPAAGHASNIDQPEAFDRAVTEFLDSV